MVPSNVAAQAVGMSASGFGANDWSEEPNVPAGGSVPSNPYGDVSGDYPADAHGLEAAFTAQAPVLVLSAKWLPIIYPVTVTLGTHSGVGLAGLAQPDTANMLRPFVGSDWMLPGQGTFVAFYGEWADYNGDKIRNDEGHWRNSVDGHDRPIYVRGNPNDACTQHDPRVALGGETTFAGGQPGNLVPVGVTVPATIEHRCTTQDEWNPPPGWSTAGTGNPEVVTYVSPGGWGGFQGPRLFRPCPLPGVDRSHESCQGTPTQQSPDISYTAGDFYGQGTYTWTTVRGVQTDGSLVETKVLETIADPVRRVDGPRTHEAGDETRTDGRPASRVDVDVYNSLDPTIESLFQDAVHDGVGGTWNGVVAIVDGPGEDLFDEWVVLNEQVNDAVEDVTGDLLCDPAPDEAVFCFADPLLGPPSAKFVNGRRDVEITGYDHTEAFHLYLDLEFRESAHWSGFLQAGNGNAGVVCTGDPHNCGPVQRISINGNFGAWHDANADGFIGISEEARTRTCPDAYDCGTVRNPHSFTEAASDGEFKPACLPGRSGAFQITLTPDGGRWGQNGAYLNYDKDSDVESTQGGRASFNPYDDYVLDVADNGRVDRLYTEGPVRMWMTCTGNSGVYGSFEDLVLLDPGRPYGITMATDVVAMTMVSAGIMTPETVSDTDHLAAMAVG